MSDVLKRPYSMWHSKANIHEAESWVIDGCGTGFGLRTFPTKERAQKAADEFFGEHPLALFTIRLFENRTVTHFAVSPECKLSPEKLLRQTIAALEAELHDLDKCPIHRAENPTK